MILEPKPKRGRCGVCDPVPAGRVSADELWARMRARSGNGFVRIGARA